MIAANATDAASASETQRVTLVRAARSLASDARHYTLLEALFRLDGPQRLAQLLFEVFAHRMSSTIAVPCTRARSSVSERLRWLLTVLMDISSVLAMSMGSISSW